MVREVLQVRLVQAELQAHREQTELQEVEVHQEHLVVVEQAVAVGLVEHQVLQALLVQAALMVLQEVVEVQVVVGAVVHQELQVVVEQAAQVE
jgi:prolyl-tRNA editing enzyme YbaK/EbsC (Cys-tRNA(Pro) deacylase)